jgi:CheY-like chemotaxis protein
MSRTLIAPIMLVEDDPNDVFFVRHALNAALIQNPLEVFASAEPAYEYLGRHTTTSAPVLIILDINLAGPQTGLDVLAWIRRLPDPLGSTPVLMLTGSDGQKERNASGHLGAIDFLQKPATAESLARAVQALGFVVVNNITSGQLGVHIVHSHPVVPLPEHGAVGARPGATWQASAPRFTYVRDDDRRRIRVTALVALEAADVAAVVERQASEGTWQFDIVYDLRAVTGARTWIDAKEAADLVRRYVTQYGRRGRVAVVTREITMVGIAQGYAYETAKSGIDVQIFWDVSDAVDWLEATPESRQR